jgi:hypothetical protein
VLAPLAFLLALLVADQPTLLVGLTAVLVIALVAVGQARTAPSNPPSVLVRARRRLLDEDAPPRQHDPDAAGHTRSRAPSRALATV